MFWGIQLKGFIAGILVAYFLVPFLMARFSGFQSRQSAPSQ